MTLQATTTGAPSTLTTSFTLNVTVNPDFVLTEPIAFPEVNAGSTGTAGSISIAAQDGFSGTVTLSCPTTYGAGSCSISPTSVSSFPATATLTINGTSFAAGTYSLSVTGTSGAVVHTLVVPFNVGDYSISGTQTLSLAPGGQGTASLTLTSSHSYSGKINATCDASALSGAMCSLSPANPVSVASGGTATLTATVNSPSTASPGTYNINITTQDTTGAPSHSFTVALTVAQDFRLTSSTPSQTVTAGQTSGAYNLAVQPVGASFNGAVTLACSAGMPAGAQCVFNPPAAVTPGNSAIDRRDEYLHRRKQGSSAVTLQSLLGLLRPVLVLAGSGDRLGVRQDARPGGQGTVRSARSRRFCSQGSSFLRRCQQRWRHAPPDREPTHHLPDHHYRHLSGNDSRCRAEHTSDSRRRLERCAVRPCDQRHVCDRAVT